MSTPPLRDLPDRRPVPATDTPFHGVIVDLVRDTVDYTPDVRFVREYVRHPGAVAVLAERDGRDGPEILLIRQYRHPVGHAVWEIPAGLLDVDGEPPATAAARELAEETGHRADHLAVLVDLRPSPGGSDEVIRVFHARGAAPLPGDGYVRRDEEADLLLRWVPLDEVVRAVLAGDMTNGTTVAAVLALHAARTLPGAPAARDAATAFPDRPGHA